MSWSEIRKDLVMIAIIFTWGAVCSLAFFWLIDTPAWLLGLWAKWFVFFLLLAAGSILLPHLVQSRRH